jgi:DNA polymerase
MPRSTGQPHRLARVAAETDLALGVDAIPRPRDAQRPAAMRLDMAPAPEPASVAHRAVDVRPAPVFESREARIAALEELRQRHDLGCPHCTVATAHTQTVFGEGDPEARIMFVGEAPGETEDRLGRPFVGRAGEKLDEMIRAMGFRREEVYIANVLKSRPPDNRTPLQHEVDACGPYLAEQIRIIRPVVIVTLGGPATKLLLRTDAGITRLRGVWATYPVDAEAAIPVMPTFHPAYLLRNYTPETRRQVWNDLQAVVRRLHGEV